MSNIVEQIDQSSIYVQPIHFILAIVTNILNICVLSDRVLRASPCTHYFLVFSIASIIYTCLICPYQLLRRYNLILNTTHAGCLLNSYIFFVLPWITNFMLVLASFDRFCSSSTSVQLRSLSNLRIARLSIIFGIIFSIIYISPMLIIYYWDSNLNLCRQYSNTIINIYIGSQIIIYYVLIPVAMITFGLLTISNIRKRTIQTRLPIRNNHHRRTEGQLTRMLSLQVGAHLIFSFPFGSIYLMNSFIPSTRTTFILGIRLAAIIWQQCDYFIPFFLYTLSSKTYRQRLFKILHLIHQRNQSHLPLPTIHQVQPIHNKAISSRV